MFGLVLLAAAALLALKLKGGATVNQNQAPLGVRNNNPGNLENNGTKWDGMSGTNGAYYTFATPDYGIRAMAKVLLTYQQQDGLFNISAIINRWAPPATNDTAAYIADVCGRMGVSQFAPIDLSIADNMRALIKAIIEHENGAQPYSVAQINSGMQMAGIV